ncbi:MAG: hypothetical protein ACI39E_03000 [Acutalibacteraceae bacterium]
MKTVFVRVIPLPPRIKGTTVEDGNGDYNVYISDALSIDEQRKVLRHEMEHISQDHFRNDDSVFQNEIEAG